MTNAAIIKNLAKFTVVSVATGMLFSATAQLAEQATSKAVWMPLFNGEDISNWQIKFTGQELGVNYRDTFRVEDGLLTVSYDDWPEFNSEFGHLFHESEFSHYILRMEYRFIGNQVEKGPDWAFRNNGVMLHSQDPASMTVAQEFPVSIEVQLLGGNGEDPRNTANVCTPGTHFELDGELIRQHCTNSSSKTFPGDQWISLEIEVHGDERIIHRVNGDEVFDYQKPQLDDSDKDAQALLAAGAPLALGRGYIALQAESHPTQFRNIQIQVINQP